MPDLDDKARAQNKVFTERLIREGWRTDGELLVHPDDKDINIWCHPYSGELLFSPKCVDGLKTKNTEQERAISQNAPKLTRLKIVEERLRGIALPPLTRPAVGPFDEATEDLAYWAIKFYAYSSIAHVRTVLAGLLALADLENVPTANIVSRHIFEWTANACYMQQELTPFINSKQWKLAFKLILQADTGNYWAKEHGHKYDSTPEPFEIPKPIRIGKLVDA